MEKLDKIQKNNEKAITLIALVITIIVLLILAGVSISMLSGENNILKRATDAKTKTEEAQIKEEITIAWNGVEVEGIVQRWDTNQKATALQTELRKGDSSATANANGTVITVTYKGYDATINDANGSLTSFTKSAEEDPNVLTVGKAYDQELINIGDAFTYTGATQTEWIVFGKDENGNVLLTTAEPVTTDSFNLGGDAQHWLSFETDLYAHCAKYGNASKGITGRSITLEDINRVTGYTEPTFTPITFGTGTGEYDNYYPTTATATAETYPYWKKPIIVSEKKFTATELHPSYSYNSSTCTSENMKYVVGISTGDAYSGGDGLGGLFEYLVASRAIGPGAMENQFYFYVTSVSSGDVSANRSYICYSSPNYVGEYGFSQSKPVRPIVVLPSSISVEEGIDGVYKLAE